MDDGPVEGLAVRRGEGEAEVGEGGGEDLLGGSPLGAGPK